MLSPATASHATPRPADLVTGNGVAAAHQVTVEHTFETAHRLPHMLPHLGGKCANLHGHSWRVAVTVTAPHLSNEVTVVEFGALKTGVRHWIDTHLDHATMLGAADPLVEPLTASGCTVFLFGAHHAETRDTGDAELLAADLAWPTVEAVAVLLHRMSHTVLTTLPRAAGARVGRVLVRETHRNTADYTPVDTP